FLITMQPSTNDTVCKYTNTGFNVKVEGTGLKFQWQRKSGDIWSDISVPGSPTQYRNWDTDSLEINNIVQNAIYRCEITDTSGAIMYSNESVLKIKRPPNILTMSSDKISCEDQQISFQVVASGDEIYYQWEVNSGSSWTKLTNGNGYSGTGESTLSVVLDGDMDGNKYRCLVNGICAPTDTSGERMLTVYAKLKIQDQPVSDAIPLGGSGGFSINASGYQLNYQWQLSNTGGATWFDITGAGTNPIHSGWTTDSMGLQGIVSANNGYMYRCRISSYCDSDSTSAAATLTIKWGVGIQSPEAVQIGLYPVPARNELEVKLPEFIGAPDKVLVYNVLGVAIEIIDDILYSGKSSFKISVAHLEEGIYESSLKRFI
ncbi:hypothetical protein LCGC14_2897480, partial [marine sediment metagenome]